VQILCLFEDYEYNVILLINPVKFYLQRVITANGDYFGKIYTHQYVICSNVIFGIRMIRADEK